MLRIIALSVAALVLAGTAHAADLAPNTRLGAVFAKPHRAAPVREEVYSYDYPLFAYAPQIDVRPLVGGYYGNPGSYYYRSYYGDGPSAVFDAYSRLPYACGFHGYC
jgi:hypothetical protein